MLKYATDAELKSTTFSGEFYTYGGGGYVIDLPLGANSSEVQDIILDLKSRKWTDRQTRALFFDFAFYNPTMDIYLSFRLLFEFLEYGAVVPTASTRVMKMGCADSAAPLADGAQSDELSRQDGLRLGLPRVRLGRIPYCRGASRPS